MFSRREFIERGVAASALAVCPSVVRVALAESDDEPYRYFKVVFDATVAEGVAFGAEAARRGAPAHAVGADLGGVWMHDIEPRWKSGPAAIAGLTRGAPLFCLELLARDYGMGVVYRAQHSPMPEGLVRHRVAGTEPLSDWENQLADAGSRWAASAAALVMRYPAARQPDPGIALVDLADRSGVADRSWFSWVIAPVRGAALSASAPCASARPARG